MVRYLYNPLRSVLFMITALILFGATGDLARRKLLPALATLSKKQQFQVLAIGRRAFTTEQYRVFADVSKELPLTYIQADISNSESFALLQSALERYENRIFYLATSHEFFHSILQSIAHYKLHKTKGFSRVIFEKPFGFDEQSSEQLNKETQKVFSEEQIFRIDHYRAKDSVQDFVKRRFTDTSFESLLNNKHLAQIEIIADESEGVGTRVSYYDSAGALKDMVQNHLLQVLSLVLMEIPNKQKNKAVHAAQVYALENLQVLLAQEQVLGQYASYQEEAKKQGIAHSKTETFARIALVSKQERWQGVEISIRTGKNLPEKRTCIILTFKDGKQETIPITSKQDEYATLIEAVMKGEHALFTRFDEVQAAWKLIDQLEQMKSKIPFILYREGTNPEKI